MIAVPPSRLHFLPTTAAAHLGAYDHLVPFGQKSPQSPPSLRARTAAAAQNKTLMQERSPPASFPRRALSPLHLHHVLGSGAAAGVRSSSPAGGFVATRPPGGVETADYYAARREEEERVWLHNRVHSAEKPSLLEAERRRKEALEDARLSAGVRATVDSWANVYAGGHAKSQSPLLCGRRGSVVSEEMRGTLRVVRIGSRRELGSYPADCEREGGTCANSRRRTL